MKCPFCDAIVPEGSVVCHFCGEPILEMTSAKELDLVETNKGEESIREERITTEESVIPPKSDDPVIVANETLIFPVEPVGCGAPKDDTPEDESPINVAVLTKEETNNADQVCVENGHSSTKVEAELNGNPMPFQSGSNVEPKSTSKKSRWPILIAATIFLFGIIVGGLLFSGRQAQNEVSPTVTQEDLSEKDTSDSGTPIVSDSNIPDETNNPDTIIDPERDEQSSLPETSNPPAVSNQSADHDATSKFEEQLVAPDKNSTVTIDSRFEGVWGVYLANEDGSIAYDDNGEMKFTGDFIVVDLTNECIFNIGQDGNLSKKWAIQKTEQDNMITFWAENGYFSLAHLVTDSAAREICGTSETDTFNMVWFKVDNVVPSYEELLSEAFSPDVTPEADNTQDMHDTSQSTTGVYAEFPGVPDFGSLNNVKPYVAWELDGRARIYVYLHTDLKAAGTYMMSYNLYDQELLKYGFTQEGPTDNASGTNVSMSYGKYENGVATAVIVNPLDNYNGEDCMSIIVGSATN